MIARRLRSIAAGRPRPVTGVLLAALALALLLSTAALAAATEIEFGSYGQEAGQFQGPSGVALNQAGGDLYIADRNNERIDQFQGSGSFVRAWGWGVLDGKEAFESCTSKCLEGIEGAGAGQFNQPQGVAVDNDPLSLSYGDVYVVDVNNHRVEQFSATGTFLAMFGGEVNATRDQQAGASEAEKNLCTAASGDTCKAGTTGTGNGQFGEWRSGSVIADSATGTVYVGDENRVQQFSEEGAYTSQVALPGAGRVRDLALDASGDMYVGSEDLSGVRRYGPTGTLLETLDAAGFPEGVALDPAGNVFIEDNSENFRVLEFSASGVELASFGEGTAVASSGITFDEATGDLYVSNETVEDTGVWVLTPPGPGPLVVRNSEQAGEVLPTSAALAARINPEGAATTYRFEYGSTASYGSSTAQSASIGAGFSDAAASVDVSGLTPATIYHYRVVAVNAAGTSFGPDQTFTTLAPASIDSESAAAVSATSATLQAQINPLGSPTTYRFEYGTTASYGVSVPSSPAELGAGTSDAGVSVHLQGLAAGTLYHYRVIASNALGTAVGRDQVFRTQLAGVETVLPDGRQWELVSPPVKEGGRILPIEEREGVQAATGGDAFAYQATAPTEPNPQGSAEDIMILSARGPDGGWSSRDIATPHEAATGSTGVGSEYRLFSPDLSLSVVEPLGKGEPPLSSLATERTMYVRNDQPLQPQAAERALYQQAEGEAAAGSGGVGYVPVVTPADTAPGVKFGGKLPEGVRFEGASPDLSHVVLSSRVALTSPPVEGALYEWSGGSLALIDVLPDGLAASSGSLGAGAAARNAISSDGSRVFWSGRDPAEEGEHLYMRDTAKGETVRLDAPQGTLPRGSSSPLFQMASSDGSRVFFTDSRRLTPQSAAGSSDIYECEMIEAAAKDACRLSDLTIDAHAGEGSGVRGLLPGVSEDGSYVYFVADGMLAPGAISGQPNLYVLHESAGAWTTTFIATLTEADEPDWSPDLVANPSRVSPDGHYLEFMSDASLTGYDNHDARSGQPDEEIYLYNAVSNRLVCASCNPTGARPAGVKINEEMLIGNHNLSWPNGGWLAADVPGWDPMGLDNSRYQSRYLTDDGRLFFDGIDSLVPQATNGVVDVYEYEPEGEGNCASSNATFDAASGGCVALISAGSSGEESVFLDASESGEDVFFLTTARLAPQDLDSAFDVYDAHLCSAAAPCPAETVSAPACTTADSCRTAPAPQPGVFGAPASATFNGAGNPAPALAKPVATAKAKSKAKRRGKANAKRKGKARKGKARKGKAKGKATRRGKPQAARPGAHSGKGATRARRRGSSRMSGKSSSSSRTGR